MKPQSTNSRQRAASRKRLKAPAVIRKITWQRRGRLYNAWDMSATEVGASVAAEAPRSRPRLPTAPSDERWQRLQCKP
eukprot:363538-Chlamydomonas_euryale.AAC.2